MKWMFVRDLSPDSRKVEERQNYINPHIHMVKDHICYISCLDGVFLNAKHFTTFHLYLFIHLFAHFFLQHVLVQSQNAVSNFLQFCTFALRVWNRFMKWMFSQKNSASLFWGSKLVKWIKDIKNIYCNSRKLFIHYSSALIKKQLKCTTVFHSICYQMIILLML